MSDGVVLITAYNSEGKLLLGRRQDNDCWTLPAGHINPGETPEEAAKREMYEESGIAPASLSFLAKRFTSTGLILYLFSAYVSGDPLVHSKYDPDDEVGEDDWKWVDIEGGLESRYYNKLHGPDSVDDNMVKQLFDIKEKEDKKEKLNKAEDEILRLLQHSDPNERMMAFKLNTVTPQHLGQAALDPDPNIHRAAIDHPLFDDEQNLALMHAPNALGQQSYLLSKPDRVQSHYLDALWRGVTDAAPEYRSNVLDIIANHPQSEQNLIRTLYLSPSTNLNQKLMLIRHQNSPADMIEHALQTFLMVPSSADSFNMANEAVRQKKLSANTLNSLLKLGIERGQDVNIQKLVQETLLNNEYGSDMLHNLIVLNRIRPNSHIGTLISSFLSGPSGTPNHIGTAISGCGNGIWSGERNNKLPDGLSDEQFDQMIEYAVQNNNKVFINRLMDHRLFGGRHLDAIYRTNPVAN